jgi:hypothetical protein
MEFWNAGMMEKRKAGDREVRAAALRFASILFVLTSP